MSYLTILSFLCLIYGSTCQEYQITPITTSSGLYYEKVGEVLLSNSNWKFVTSVDYGGYLAFYQYLVNKSDELRSFCEILSTKECIERFESIKNNLNKIEEIDESLAHFLGISDRGRRVRRFLFGLIGGIIGGVFGGIFGGSRRQDLSKYDRQINELQQGQRELEFKMNLQTTLFKLDSERKSMQIDWLKKNQNEIQNKIVSLESTFTKDSAEKQKQIDELKKILGETQEQIKMQKEALNKVTSRVDEIEKRLGKVDNEIKAIKEQISNNTKKIDQLQVAVQLNSLSINFNFLLNQFETEQKILFDVINNANRGYLDPYILTPLRLTEMLEKIQQNLPEGTKFPFYPNIENSRKLYNLIKPSVNLYNSKIIFILEIPLVNSKIYNFHKMTSLPVPVNKNKFIFILPKQNYLMVDNLYQEYSLISSSNFDNYCKEISTNLYLCKQVNQISSTFTSQECELDIFKTAKNIPKSCNIRVMQLEYPVFLQLMSVRSWIYAVPESENLIVTCGNTRNIVTIKGTGFIHLNEQCSASTTNNFKLLSLLEFTKPVEFNYSSPVDLTNFVELSDVEATAARSTQQTQLIFPFDLETLKQISVLVDKTTNLLGLYIFLAVLLVTVIVLAYLIYSKKIDIKNFKICKYISKNKNQPPSPSENDNGKLQIRFKVNKNQDNIKNISVHESPSTNDPEAEYITVKVKVKKNEKPTTKQMLTEGTTTQNKKLEDATRKDKSVEQDNYLNELRKIKPSKY